MFAMFSYVVTAVFFCSAVQLAAASSVSPRNNGAPGQPMDAMLSKRQDWGASSASSASASASATVNAQVMLQGWSSLSTAASQCQSVFQSQASVDVAIQAATSFSSRFDEVNRQYGQCDCGGPSAAQSAAQYKETITKLLTSMQVILQTGQRQYGSAWSGQFKPIFQRCSPAFATMKNICGSLKIDLGATLQQAHLDVNLFLGVGLNLNALLGVNLQIGGLLDLGAPSASSASPSVSPTVNADVMVQGWSSLTTAASQCQSVFQSRASVAVAIQAAGWFSSRVDEVNRQYGQCACGGPSSAQISAQYKETITKLLTSMQVILQTGQRQYASAWNGQFRPIFQRCSPAFATMKNICGSLNIDLGATLEQAHLDLHLFLGVGLNLNALLGLNLRLGGLLSL